MQLNAKTKIDDLLKQYPFLLDYLITLSPKFENLKNPLMRKTIGKVATLEKAALIGGLKLEDLIAALTAEIGKQSGDPAHSGDFPPSKSGTPSDSASRREVLKGIIKDLHRGEDMEALKKRFREVIRGV